MLASCAGTPPRRACGAHGDLPEIQAWDAFLRYIPEMLMRVLWCVRVQVVPVQVMRLHNELAAAANTEAHHIATHADLWRTVYAAGANEKYIPFLQTMPAFQELPPEAAAEAGGSEYDTAVEEATRMMDSSEIAEFKRNLSWALGEVRRRPAARRACDACVVAWRPE